jgi:hypothetical protein
VAAGVLPLYSRVLRDMLQALGPDDDGGDGGGSSSDGSSEQDGCSTAGLALTYGAAASPALSC